MSFDNKVVLITGGSSGIGAAIAIAFAKKKAKVAIVGRNETKLKNTSDKCEQSGGIPLVIIADVTKDEDIKRIVSNTVNHFGKLDILVNNAGVAGAVGVQNERVIEVFDNVVATNLRAPLYLTHLALPHLIETKGNIINISSIAAIGVLTANSAPYSAVKAGLDHFTRCAALELAPKGVRVNSVNPGPVKTDMMDNIVNNEEEYSKLIDMMTRATAIGRMSESEEIADLVLYLAGDKAKSITGGSYVIDGGSLLKGCWDTSNQAYVKKS